MIKCSLVVLAIAALVPLTARAACTESEDLEWLAARHQFVGRERLQDFDALLRKRLELCAAVASARLQPQQADKLFQKQRQLMLTKWGQPESARAF